MARVAEVGGGGGLQRGRAQRQVRPLFVEFVAGVMEGEAVRGCRKGVAALAEEIVATEEVLRWRNKIGSFTEFSARVVN